MDPWAESDETKLAELLLYVAHKELEDLPGGATKVNKILFFAEFSHIRAYGVPITGEPYQKLENGPAPRHLIPIRDQLIADGAAYLRKDDYFGRPLHRLVPKRPAAVNRFTQNELRVTDQVITALWGKTAKEVSDLSHEEMGWRMVEDGEDIPLPSAFLAKRAVSTDKTRARARELSQNLGLSG
jgi:Protein of unknown function (DUF4065)